MKTDILAFAAHPDDIEISCGATIIKHIRLGKKVVIADFTRGELGTRGSAEIRDMEAAESARIMGIHQRVNLGFRDVFFVHDERHILKIVETIRRFQPEIVIANAPNDRHPDHGRASKMVDEACFLSGLRRITMNFEGEDLKPWRPKTIYHYIQDQYLDPDFIVDVTGLEEDKMTALKAFKSQFFDPDSKEPVTPISRKDFFDVILGQMKVMGRSIGVAYGEGFIAHRHVGVNCLTDLV